MYFSKVKVMVLVGLRRKVVSFSTYLNGNRFLKKTSRNRGESTGKSNGKKVVKVR